MGLLFLPQTAFLNRDTAPWLLSYFLGGYAIYTVLQSLQLVFGQKRKEPNRKLAVILMVAKHSGLPDSRPRTPFSRGHSGNTASVCRGVTKSRAKK